MGYQVLYRKYRPSTFDEVVGQDYIVKTLKNAIQNQQIAHAYLFAGPRGTGKTSIAKLFAKMVNCTNSDAPCGECDNCKAVKDNTHPDIIELDAASNNKVEDIRQLIDNVIYAPILGKYKVYIIDEAHMLTTSAFNAFLKTLEEPPANVIFILATTEPQKIIPTVLSRCQRYNFTKIDTQNMKKRLAYILEKENIPYDQSALDLIISLSDGGMRDVLSILEQVLAYGNNELRTKDVIKIYGLLTNEEKVNLLINLKQGEIDSVMVKVREMYQSGIDIKRLSQDLIQILKEVLIYQETSQSSLLKNITVEDVEKLSGIYNGAAILQAIDILIKTIDNYHQTQDVLSYFEIALLKIKYINNEVKFVEKPKVEKKKEKVETKVEIKETKKVEEVVKSDELPQDFIQMEPEVIVEPEILPQENEETIILEPEVELSFEKVDTNNLFLLSILLEADRDEKMKDIKIYHTLADYNFDIAKRRFFTYLKGTEIFASQKDAIIFSSSDEYQINQINDIKNNEELYYFLKEEYGIDKMLYAIGDSQKQELIHMFKNASNYPVQKCHIKRYTKENNEISLEDKLKDLFGNVKIED